MKTLKQLKSDFKKAKTKYLNLRNELDKRSDEANIPGLKAKYEGKFFRYENSSGSENSWPIFSYCKKVTSQRMAIADNFETTPNQNEFKINEEVYHHLFVTEITREEYNTALLDFTSKCLLLSQNLNNNE